jgi:hypothetical protein
MCPASDGVVRRGFAGTGQIIAFTDDPVTIR